MEKLNIKNILLVGTIILFNGCIPSLVYSPSINLPPKPLEKKDFQIIGGAGYFPETLPDKTPEELALCGEITFRYGFTDAFSMQLKGWHDYSDNVDEDRWGVSIGSIIMLNDSSNVRFGMMPNIALLYGNNTIEGGGGSLPFTIWLNQYNPLNLYFGIGPILGMRDITEGRNQWGWGILINSGIGLLINERLTINIEAAIIKQVNEYNGNKNDFFSPSLNIGYIF